jgi:hypothetical protein
MDRQYTEQLLIEGIAVGGLTAVVGGVIQRMLPRASPVLRLFLTGVAIHFGCEYTGLNEWYLTNSASAMKYYRDKAKDEEGELFSSITSESKCQFMDMSSCQHSGLEELPGSMQNGFVRILRK